jgi:hypothetical protein
MNVDQIEQRRVAEELIHKTAIDIRKMIDYVDSQVGSVIDDDIECRIRDLVFDE